MRTKARRIVRWAMPGFAICVAALGVVACWPMPFPYAAPKLSPPTGYAEAKAQIEKTIAKAPQTLSEAGRPRVFLHDAPTGHVFVLLHGLTNSPEQFDKLGRILFERGHNVVIPRTPGHGDANLMTDALSVFTAKAMLDYANLAITLSRPLGRHLTVAGLSINGTTTAWVAQNRADVDCAVLLAPFLSPRGLPRWANQPLSRLLIRLPNVFLWWDPVHKDQLAGSPHAYPRFSTRSIGETMMLGSVVLRESGNAPPACGSMIVVTSASDLAANNALTARLAANWQRLRPGVVQSYEFPASEKVPHDFIDPSQSDQRVDIVYPRLIEMLETGKAP